ncbi:hypothetical protein CDL15_Pgr026028 [Punica granatum]|uniref:Protein kinase domain-containing protein n=1 Tax=Punica granatum TaxID=22663 RepID=A0A218WCI3_PUNGR|nr:hypothetical protein CDL15_Pgr026028 [Punica granatum]
MAVSAAAPAIPISALRGRRSRTFRATAANKPEQSRAIGNFRHFKDAVKKDFDFMRKGIRKGVEWANEALRIPKVARALDDVLWLRTLERPDEPPPEPSPWPQPWYPELSGLHLLMADVKAMEAYISYFYCLSRVWSKALPETYDPEGVADYFICRPHVVALRLIEVLSALASAAIRIRTTGVTKSLIRRVNKESSGNISQYDFGLVLKETMLNLGPTFIKVGQSLSTRPDIIGTEISKALSELHDQIPPFPRVVAMKIMEEELSSPVQSVFSYISDEPVAAASFGQVYRGKTVDGFDVAVKVQRPNLHHVVLGLLQKIAKRKSDLRLYADELGKGLVGELDYTLEASNASEFLEVHSSFSFIHVPKVFKQLTRKRVLTMEWMVGESPTDLISVATGYSVERGSYYSEKQKHEAKRRLLDMVNKGVEASLIQLLETGLLHADPHPGNLRYTSSGKLGFLDFGLLCRMERRHQFAMLASIVHIVNGDWASLVQALTEMDVVRPGTNLRRVTLDLEYALGEVEFRDGIPDVKFSRIAEVCFSYAVIPSILVIVKGLSHVSLAVAGDRNFKTFEAAYPYVVRKLLMENSVETRRILHSVVFTKKKEFRWERLSLFLRVGTTRKTLQGLVASNAEASVDLVPKSSTGAVNMANLVLRLLPSKDGVILRRLLMTADGASLVQAMVSKEAVFFRQQLCGVIADTLYKWMSDAIGLCSMVPANREAPVQDHQVILRDRRIRVIALKALGDARRDPLLMLRLCWVSFVMGLTASAMACHRVIVNLSEAYFGPISLVPKRFAISA